MKTEVLSASQQMILGLIKDAIWHMPLSETGESSFDELLFTASRHAVVSMLYPVMREHAELLGIAPACMAKWRSAAIASLISDERVMAGQGSALALLQDAGIRVAVHKGSAVARYYPESTMRSLGDVDLLVLPEDYQRAVSVLIKAGYRKGSEEHPYHTALFRAGVTFEIHFAVSRMPKGAAGEHLEAAMAQAVEQAREVDLHGNTFLALSPLHQAIALLMHMQKHMTSGGIGLRQLCDWMMFVSSVSKEEWSEILPVLESVGLKKYAQIMTKTCQCYLGLPDEHSFWAQDISERLCRLTIVDVFRGGNVTNRENEQLHSGLFLEDVGHFSSPFHGKMRSFHVLIYRLDQSAASHYPKTHRLWFLRPALWAITGCRHLWKREGKVDIRESRRIAEERRELYSAAAFFK